MKKPFLLLIDGMTGAGKTSVSKLLAQKLPRTAIIGLDKVKLFISDFERNPTDNGIAREVTQEMAKVYFKNEISVIIEQPLKSEEVDKYEDIAEAFSAPIYKVQMFTTPETSLKRVLDRQKDRENKLTEDHIKRNIAYFKSKEDRGFKQIDTTSITVEEVAQEILSLLES